MYTMENAHTSDEWMTVRLFGVNGVTFNNEEKDGGESRQAILLDFFEKRQPGDDTYKTFCWFKRDDWNGEFAVKVIVEGKVVGYVPREHLHSFEEEKESIPYMRGRVEIGINPQNVSVLYALIGL